MWFLDTFLLFEATVFFVQTPSWTVMISCLIWLPRCFRPAEGKANKQMTASPVTVHTHAFFWILFLLFFFLFFSRTAPVAHCSSHDNSGNLGFWPVFSQGSSNRKFFIDIFPPGVLSHPASHPGVWLSLSQGQCNPAGHNTAGDGGMSWCSGVRWG